MCFSNDVICLKLDVRNCCWTDVQFISVLYWFDKPMSVQRRLNLNRRRIDFTLAFYNVLNRRRICFWIELALMWDLSFKSKLWLSRRGIYVGTDVELTVV